MLKLSLPVGPVYLPYCGACMQCLHLTGRKMHWLMMHLWHRLLSTHPPHTQTLRLSPAVVSSACRCVSFTCHNWSNLTDLVRNDATHLGFAGIWIASIRGGLGLTLNVLLENQPLVCKNKKPPNVKAFPSCWTWLLACSVSSWQEEKHINWWCIYGTGVYPPPHTRTLSLSPAVSSACRCGGMMQPTPQLAHVSQVSSDGWAP